MLSCPKCNAKLRFDPESQKLKCDYCNNTYNVAEVSNDSSAINYANFEAENSNEYQIDGTIYTCGCCGAEIISDDDTAVTFCSYCGASVELKRRVARIEAPSYIIPFKTTKEQTIKNYKKLVKRSIFAPSYIKKESNIENIRGIYMPYWIFSFEHEGKLAYQGFVTHNQETNKITEYYSLVCDGLFEYKSLCFDASASFYDSFSSAINPYNREDFEVFMPGYMSGFYADSSNISAEAYESEAKGIVLRDIGIKFSKTRTFKKFGGDINLGDGYESSFTPDKKLAYFPVWFLSTRNQNDKVSYAVINGQTGKMAADIPIDFFKYILGSILLAIPIAAGLLFAPKILPIYFNMIISLIAFLLFFIASNELDKVYTRCNLKNDKGYQIAKFGDVLADFKFAERYVRKDDKKKKPNQVIFFLKIYGFSTLIFWLMILSVFLTKNPSIGFIFLLVVAPFMICVINLLRSIKIGKVKKNRRKIYIFKQSIRNKLYCLIKPVLVIIISMVLMIWSPTNNTYICGGLIINCILIFLTICDLIKAHNNLTQNAIPQFGKRG